MHLYEVRPRKDKGGFDSLSDALPTGWTRDWDDADDYTLMLTRQANVSIADMAKWFGVPEQEIEERINALLFHAAICRPD